MSVDGLDILCSPTTLNISLIIKPTYLKSKKVKLKRAFLPLWEERVFARV